MGATLETEGRASRSILWPSYDGLQLHAVVYEPSQNADRLPVVCIPGLTRNARDFDALGPWLAAKGRRVFAVDLRGRGRSQYGPASRYRAASYADDIRRLIRTQNVARAHVIGTSLGGIVAMTMAMGDRSTIAGAVLNDIGPELGAAGVKRIASYAGARLPAVKNWVEAAALVRQAYHTTFPRLDEADWSMIAERSFRTSETGELVLDYDPAVAHGGAAQPSSLAAHFMWRGFKRLAGCGPILSIRGARSDLFEAATLARMKRSRPALMRAEIPEVGHAPTLDEPEARAALAAFFALVD
jgi:pimeloyl-ACP methyl ester carboxylesterase